MEASTWIALVALAFTGTQAWIAHRKLRFDLFAKRFETWNAYNDALNGRRDEIREGARAGDVTSRDTCQKEMWRQKRLMLALFPPEVHRALESVDLCLIVFMSNIIDPTIRDVGTPEAGQRAVARYQAFQAADQELSTAQMMVLSLVHRYIRQYGWWEQHATPRMRSAGAWSESTWRRVRTWTAQLRSKQPD
ncbi:hypothetical protein ASG32_30735 [Methylobacterium sp. Leaf361]|uniref:hypothetical protein n=1 Tax=Methylobacterium sp. Leaf361 TaxID=1736352 RepID=UPI0006F4FD2C|nr:hypothetical protein [Methylobacterium sp. Leaf361]KQS66504.1 hypothetical protein ASG32_30735 [Methylobacterium sp. Leaf361]